MPFTISHIAAALPVHRSLRRWGLFSAAIVGTMVPDFGFLLPAHLTREATHSAAALLTFCLPMGLAAFWMFQLLIKPAWCVVLPGRWRHRLRVEHPVARLGNWRIWLGAAAAVLAGAFTHLVWDGFTHEDGRGVRMLPFLDDFGPGIEGHTLRLFRWLQLLSSVLGLLAVAIAAWRWSRGDIRLAPQVVPADSKARSTQWHELGARERHAWLAGYLLIPVGVLVGYAALVLPHLPHRPSWGDLLTRLAFLGLKGAGASLLLVSALIRWRVASQPPPLDA